MKTDNVTQIRGTPCSRIQEHYEKFVEKAGEPIEGVLILATNGRFMAHAYTGPYQRLSDILGLIELAKLQITKDWYATDD